MIFSGLELIGDIPFEHVIIHTTVLAPDGRRMSKSLGTGLDPLELIDEHGADATRYGLLKLSSSQDVRFAAGALEEGRKLANKLWNAARLILMNAEGALPALQPEALEERWIVARMDDAQSQVDDALRELRVLACLRCPLPPGLRRLLRLVRRSHQAAASTTATSARAAPRWPCWSGS